MLCYVMLCYVMLCYVMLCYVMLYYYIIILLYLKKFILYYIIMLQLRRLASCVALLFAVACLADVTAAVDLEACQTRCYDIGAACLDGCPGDTVADSDCGLQARATCKLLCGLRQTSCFEFCDDRTIMEHVVEQDSVETEPQSR